MSSLRLALKLSAEAAVPPKGSAATEPDQQPNPTPKPRRAAKRGRPKGSPRGKPKKNKDSWLQCDKCDEWKLVKDRHLFLKYQQESKVFCGQIGLQCRKNNSPKSAKQKKPKGGTRGKKRAGPTQTTKLKVPANVVRHNTKRPRLSKGSADPADYHALSEAMEQLVAAWRSPDVAKKECSIEVNEKADGLLICREFLSLKEIQCLRKVFDAHHSWGLYIYGGKDVKGFESRGDDSKRVKKPAKVEKGLDSVVQRLDFGPTEMRAEGFVGDDSPVWPLKHQSLLGERQSEGDENRDGTNANASARGGAPPPPPGRAALLAMVVTRFRTVFDLDARHVWSDLHRLGGLPAQAQTQAQVRGSDLGMKREGVKPRRESEIAQLRTALSTAADAAGDKGAGTALSSDSSRIPRLFAPRVEADALSSRPAAISAQTQSANPNTLQMTQICPSEVLGNHYDSRNKWLEGIASVAWGKEPSPLPECAFSGEIADENQKGEPWSLVMERGKGIKTSQQVSPRNTAAVTASSSSSSSASSPPPPPSSAPGGGAHMGAHVVAAAATAATTTATATATASGVEEFVLQLPAGTGYLLSRAAQGRTAFCYKACVGHQACRCCWTHGIRPVEWASVVRQSMTIRTYDMLWGR